METREQYIGYSCCGVSSARDPSSFVVSRLQITDPMEDTFETRVESCMTHLNHWIG
jgi:hypothetical protein